MSVAAEGRDAQQHTYTRCDENRDDVMDARTPPSRRGLEHDSVKPLHARPHAVDPILKRTTLPKLRGQVVRRVLEPVVRDFEAGPGSNAISVTKEICDRVFAHACSAGTDAALRCDRQPRHRFVLEGDIRCRIFGAVGDDDRWHRRHAARRGCRGAQSRWQEGRRHENACQSKPQRAAACNSPRHSPTSAVPVQIRMLCSRSIFLLQPVENSVHKTFILRSRHRRSAKPVISPCRGQFQE